MQATIEEYEEDARPLTDGEYEEGLDDDDDDYDEEEYDEEADLIEDEDLEGALHLTSTFRLFSADERGPGRVVHTNKDSTL